MNSDDQNPQSEALTSPDPLLDVSQRLALQIIGVIGLHGHLTRLTINPNDGGLQLLFQDITAAIQSSLLYIDMVELKNLGNRWKESDKR